LHPDGFAQKPTVAQKVGRLHKNPTRSKFLK